MKQYLFSYYYKGAEWSFSVLAESEQEARERVARMASARLDGILVAETPATFGWLAKAFVALKNIFRKVER